VDAAVLQPTPGLQCGLVNDCFFWCLWIIARLRAVVHSMQHWHETRAFSCNWQTRTLMGLRVCTDGFSRASSIAGLGYLQAMLTLPEGHDRLKGNCAHTPVPAHSTATDRLRVLGAKACSWLLHSLPVCLGRKFGGETH
jgi:hypothetical protein